MNVPVTSGTPSVGTIVGSPAVFNPGDSSNSSTAFHPLAVGMSILTVGVPAGFSTPSNGRQITATVRAPGLGASPNPITVGSDLQVAVQIFVDAAPPSPTAVTVSVPSTATSIATVSADGTVAGGSTVTLTATPGTTFVGTVFVQGRGLGDTTLGVLAAGYTSVSSAVAVQPSGFVFVACPFCNLLAGDFTTTSSAGDTALTVAAAILDPTFLTFQSQQAVRGGLAVNVPVTSATTSVGTIVGSPAVFTSGDSFNLGTAFHPLAAGMSVLTVGTPAGFSMPSNGRQITAAVQAPTCLIEGDACGSCGNGVCVTHCGGGGLVCADVSTANGACSTDAQCAAGQSCGAFGASNCGAGPPFNGCGLPCF